MRVCLSILWIYYNITSLSKTQRNTQQKKPTEIITKNLQKSNEKSLRNISYCFVIREIYLFSCKQIYEHFYFSLNQKKRKENPTKDKLYSILMKMLHYSILYLSLYLSFLLLYSRVLSVLFLNEIIHVRNIFMLMIFMSYDYPFFKYYLFLRILRKEIYLLDLEIFRTFIFRSLTFFMRNGRKAW